MCPCSKQHHVPAPLALALCHACSFTVSYESKWLVTQGLPVILVLAVLAVLLITRTLQCLQRTVFRVVPFGATGDFNLLDVCIGVLITGSYYLYFRKCWGLRSSILRPTICELLLTSRMR